MIDILHRERWLEIDSIHHQTGRTENTGRNRNKTENLVYLSRPMKHYFFWSKRSMKLSCQFLLSGMCFHWAPLIGMCFSLGSTYWACSAQLVCKQTRETRRGMFSSKEVKLTQKKKKFKRREETRNRERKDFNLTKKKRKILIKKKENF